jgi:hypothetical protein
LAWLTPFFSNTPFTPKLYPLPSGVKYYLPVPNLPLKKEIIGQSLLGSRGFVKWVKENFLGDKISDRELPKERYDRRLWSFFMVLEG